MNRPRTPQQLLPEDLHNLKLRALQAVQGALAGCHPTNDTGASVDFAAYRDYSPGDELRHVDWRLFGRTDKHYVKQYQAETKLRAIIAVDVSGSMHFADEANHPAKMTCALGLATALAALLIRQGDAVGALAFAAAERAYLPPSSRRGHLDDLLHTLLNAQAHPTVAPQTDLAPLCQSLMERLRRPGLVVLISDFIVDPPSLEKTLRRLRSRGHDVAVLHLIDPAERDFPYEGMVRFAGLEGEGHLLCEADLLRADFVRLFAAHCAAIAAACHHHQVDYHVFDTARPWVEIVRAWLARRSQHRPRRRLRATTA